jgi:hypothetical protein
MALTDSRPWERNFKVQPWQVYKTVYDMCYPVGMGFLQFVPEDMTEEQAKAEVAHLTSRGQRQVGMDYVHGRQCKFSFRINDDGTCGVPTDRWYDHTPSQLDELISKLEKLETA